MYVLRTFQGIRYIHFVHFQLRFHDFLFRKRAMEKILNSFS